MPGDGCDIRACQKAEKEEKVRKKKDGTAVNSGSIFL